jgi:hypothetical protein
MELDLPNFESISNVLSGKTCRPTLVIYAYGERSSGVRDIYFHQTYNASHLYYWAVLRLSFDSTSNIPVVDNVQPKKQYTQHSLLISDLSTVGTLIFRHNNGIQVSGYVSYIIDSYISVMSILHMKEISSLLDVIGATEKDIDFFERYLLCLRNKEVNEECQADIDGEEEEEGFLYAMLV